MSKVSVLAPAFFAIGSLLAVSGRPLTPALAEDRVEAQGASQPIFRWGKTGQPLKLEIGAPDGQKIRYVRIVGVPGNSRLSRGFSVRDGSIWYVAANDIAALALIPPADFAGVARLSVDFVMNDAVASDQAMPQSQLYVLDIGNQIGTIPVTTSIEQKKPASPPRETPAVAEREKKAQPYQEESAALSRAQDFLRRGDVASARLLYEDLALSGSAQGALALARTFDPDFLRSTGAFGMQPDLELARKWYQKASELGNGEASRRLSNLR